MIVTFYSFKGGVGRSMALANVSEILAEMGYRVAVCDWDLEAPGLERSYTRTQSEADALAAKPGLMDLLRAYKETLAGAVTPRVTPAHVRIGDIWLPRPSSYAVPVSMSRSGGSIALLTAGSRPADGYSKYADDVRRFDWQDFYEEWAGGSYIDFVRADLSAGIPTPNGGALLPPAVDITLVDSRTGVTEHGGVCTHHLADLVVLMSAANDSNFYGALRIAQSLRAPDLESKRSGRRVLVLPVCSRIEWTSQIGELNDFRGRFRKAFGPFLPGGFSETFFEEAEIPYIPLYSFGEANLAREQEKREPKLYKAYHVLAAAIAECGITSGLLRTASATSSRIETAAHRAPEAMSVLEGTLAVLATADAAELAERIKAELMQRRITTVSTSEGVPAAAGNENAAVVHGAALVVGSTTPERWIRAQFDELLRRRALDSEFRILPVLGPDVQSTRVPYLSRARVIRLYQGEDGTYLPRLTRDLAGPPGAIELEPPALCPYPGPRPFDASEARFFFGRDQELKQLLRAVEGNRLVVVAGPAGVGRTSFLNAALLPAFHRGEPFGGPAPSVLHYQIAAGTIAELAAAIVHSFPTLSPRETEASLRNDERWLADRISSTLKTAGSRFAVIVDDFHRLSGPRPISEEAGLARRQIANVFQANLPVVVVIAVRSEGPPDVFPHGLTEPAAAFRLPELNHHQLVDAVVGPARLAGLALDARLPDRIGVEAHEVRAPLALTQALLVALWQRRSGATVTEAALQNLGGMAAVAVDQATLHLGGLSESERRHAQRLLGALALDRRDLGISRRAAARLAGGRTGDQLLERLTGPVRMIEVDGGRVRLAPYLRLHGATDTAAPASAVKWEALRTWAENERDRRQLLRFAALMCGLVCVLIASLAFLYVQRLAGLRSEAAALTLAARERLEVSPLEGLDLAIQSAEAAERSRSDLSIEAAREMLSTILTARFPTTVLVHDRAVRAAAISADGTRVATGDDAGTVRVWDPTGGIIRTVKHAAAVTAVRFSPDGKMLVTASNDQSAVGWDVATGSELWRLPTSQWIVTLELSRDGRLAAAGSNGSVWLRSPSGTVAELRAHSAAVTSLSFSRDGRLLLTASVDGSARLWDVEQRSMLLNVDSLGPGVVIAALAADGRVVVVAGRGAQIIPLAPANTAPIELAAPDDTGLQVEFSAEFSPSNRLIVTVGTRGARVWNRADGTLVLSTPSSNERAAADSRAIAKFHPNDQTLFVSDERGRATLWDVSSASRTAVLTGHQAALREVQFSLDGRWLVTASDDGRAAWWSAIDTPIPADGSLSSLLERARNAKPRILVDSATPAYPEARR